MKKDVCEENVKMAEKQVVMTLEGLKKLEDELENLKTVRRAEISEKIKIARGFGDLSENAEYDEAKKEQAEVEIRIVNLEKMLKNAKVIDDDDVSTDMVTVGSKVKVNDVDFGDIEEYSVVGSTEASPSENKISDESPIGKALLNAKIGDTVTVEAPNGEYKLEILEISK